MLIKRPPYRASFVNAVGNYIDYRHLANEHGYDGHQRAVSAVKAYIKDIEAPKVLDVNVASWLVTDEVEALFSDAEIERVDVAAKVSSEFGIEMSNAYMMKHLRKKYFDVVIAHGVLGYHPNEHLPLLLSSMSSLIKPEGSVVFTAVHETRGFLRNKFDYARFALDVFRNPEIASDYLCATTHDARAVQGELNNNGLKSVHQETFWAFDQGGGEPVHYDLFVGRAL